MKKRSPFLASPARTTHTVRTGEHCPESGWWIPLDLSSDGAARFVGKGGLMPAFSGAPVIWIPQLNG